MKLFTCGHCGQLLHFENTKCERCGSPLGFEPGSMELYPLQETGDRIYQPLQYADSKMYRYCSNKIYNSCNWLVPADSGFAFCRACSLNRTIPDLSKPAYMHSWQKIEIAKHRLIYALLRLNLPIESKFTNPENGLLFDFIANENPDANRLVLTGHVKGVITLNIAEADDIEREMARLAMDEVYRTVLGHFRHESGHYYWDRLVEHSPQLEAFRQLFGDERQDYSAALQRHYNQGPPAHWEKNFISAYASSHPWEDWAETWAHYLHIVDTLETAHSFGISIEPVIAATQPGASIDIDEDPYMEQQFSTIMQQWVPLSLAMNSLNRSMGLPDSYPFIITEAVTKKLEFIHMICYRNRKFSNTVSGIA